MTSEPNRLADLVTREKATFLGFIRRQMWDISHMDAEDILSEVIFSLFERADVVAEVEHLTAYLYRSIRNRIIDTGRREARKARDENIDLDTIQDASPNADGLLGASEFHRRLQGALASLNFKEREIWIATEIQGQTFRELAKAWDEPMGTLLARKSRAGAKLRQLMHDFQGGIL